jgi:hypothetical protein
MVVLLHYYCTDRSTVVVREQIKIEMTPMGVFAGTRHKYCMYAYYF